MNDMLFYAATLLEDFVNFIGRVLFFLFILPLFLLIFVPLLVASASIVFTGVGLYLTYVCCGVAWELVKNSIRWILTGKPAPNIRPARRRSIYQQTDLLDALDYADHERQRRRSGTSTPRRIAQPRSRSGSMHLQKSESLHSLVGPGSDRDFEGTGGWANSNEEDEAMYMARTVGVQEPMYSPVLYNSESSSNYYSSQSSRSSIPSIKSGTKDELWKFTAGGGQGSSTPRAHQHGSTTPESYFALPMNSSKGSVGGGSIAGERPGSSSSAQSAPKKRNSSSSSLVRFEDGRNSNRDSGFYG